MSGFATMEDRPGEGAKIPAGAKTPAAVMDMHLQLDPRSFEKEAEAFLGDVINMVDDWCIGYFDEFDSLIKRNQLLDTETKVVILQGIETLYKHVQTSLDSNLEQWEGNARKKIFKLPPGALLPPSQAQVAANSAGGDPAEEQALDKELRELRQKIEEANASCSALKRQLRAFDREIARGHSQAERLKTAVQPKGGSNVGAVASQVANMAARLQPLLAKAEKLQRLRGGPLTGGREGRRPLPGSNVGWLDNLQLGPPEDIARLRSSLRAQPSVSSRSEQDSRSQASVHV